MSVGYKALTPDCTIAGVDEAGRGPLAGPLLVAAVVLDPKNPILGIDDSKRLTEARREALFEQIIEHALDWHIEQIDPAEIDRLNILQATMKGMRLSVCGLRITPALALIDGNRLPQHLPCPAQAIVKGDALEPAIGAASILAKVTRDRLMHVLHRDYPGYGFNLHKGYPTPVHIEALRRLGPCPAHRMTYAPVRNSIQAAFAGRPA